MKPLYYVIIISYVIVTNCETLRLQDLCSNLNSPPPYHPIRSVWFQHNLKRTSSSYQWQCCWTFVIIAYNPTARHANIRSYNSPFQTGKLSFANIWQRANESYEAYRSHSSEPWIMIASHASHICMCEAFIQILAQHAPLGREDAEIDTITSFDM